MMDKIETIKMSSTAVVSFSVTIICSMLMSLLEKSESMTENMKLFLGLTSAFIYLGLYLGSLSGVVSFFDKFIIKKGDETWHLT